MTLREQAWQSGLVLSDENAQWNTNNWPPLKGGERYSHASVVLNPTNNKTNNTKNDEGQTVVVIGGLGRAVGDSVVLLDLEESNRQWRNGPPLNKKRCRHAVVVCNRGIYVIAGEQDDSVFADIERIGVDDLLQHSSLSSSSSKKSNWTTLKCRLSKERARCGAVAVHDRYIVVAGGHQQTLQDSLSSVEVLDTNSHVVTAGPSMAVPRSFCTCAVIGHRIYVVGGSSKMEYWDFAKPCENAKTMEETASRVISPSSTWTTYSHWELSVPVRVPEPSACTAVGSCLVLLDYGGTVTVLDTHRNRLWDLPSFDLPRYGSCTLVTLGNQIAAIGGGSDGDACGTFGLMYKNLWCFRQLKDQ